MGEAHAPQTIIRPPALRHFELHQAKVPNLFLPGTSPENQPFPDSMLLNLQGATSAVMNNRTRAPSPLLSKPRSGFEGLGAGDDRN